MNTDKQTVTGERTPARVIETPVYAFDDLDEDAKQAARNWYREGALDYDWWDSTYEDAETIGLRIKSFELDRGRHATGCFTKYIGEVIDLILANHGDQCETFKTAMQYKGELEIAEKNEREHREIDEIEAEFLKSLLEDYSIMLQHEFEYLLSDEAVDDMIRANEYTFTETGRREG
jgi:hypothetical protein